jgi:V/A-type H+-transporting ATPase subunit C
VRARKGRLLNEKQISELIETANIAEVENYLSGIPDYSDIANSSSLEKSLDTQMGETYDMIARIAPKDIAPAFKVFSKKSDINNIKSLLAAKEVGLNQEETSDLLVPTGKLYEDIQRLTDVTSVNDVIAGLDNTEYSSILSDALPDYEEKKMLLPLDAALDKYYLKTLLGAQVVPSEPNTEILYSYIGNKVDVANLNLIIRAKADNLDYDSIGQYMFNGGYQLREWKLKDLMEAEDVLGIVSSLDGTKYAAVLNAVVPEYNETGSIDVFEKALNKFLSEAAHTYAMKQPLGIGPILGYLTLKEQEIYNLKIIARAKRETNFPTSQIREMLL